MTVKDVVIVSGARTPVGDFGGALKDIPPVDLAALVTREAVVRAGIENGDVDHVIFGNVIHTEPRDMYLSRVGALQAGIPQTSSALTLNRLCGSGLEAVVSGAQRVMLGDASTVVAGGAESMSRAGYLMQKARWGARLGDSTVTDMLTGVLSDPFGHGHMGVTAENIAQSHGICRTSQDEFALESHRRASTAIAEGRFREQIVSVEIPQRKEKVLFSEDEHVRGNLTGDDLQKLRPAFKKDGTVTAGNASGLNDGAAAVVLMDADIAAQRGLKPFARVVSYGYGGVPPEFMGLGPVPAVRQALERARLQVSDLDAIESNEAFAAQACAVTNDLGLPPDRTNPNGGAIALGHPLGATGAIITVKLVYELRRTQGRYGLATMCIGGGQGIALIIECI